MGKNNTDKEEHQRTINEEEFNSAILRAMTKLKVRQQKLFCKILSLYNQENDPLKSKFKIDKCELIRFLWPKEIGDRDNEKIPARYFKMLDEMLNEISQLQIEFPPEKCEEPENEFPSFAEEFPSLAAQFPFFSQIEDEDTKK